jgi:nitrate reductase cytochrome c-type subunit
MFNKIIISMLFLVSPLVWSINNNINSETSKHGFIGKDACGMCHKSEKQGKQLDIWKASKHAQAFKVLESEEANKIAKEKGFNTPAAKTPACLKCHVSGSNAEASILGAKFKMEDGVQCETCHGAGADYKAINVMKDKVLAIKNGLKANENMKTLCISCHNANSPTYKGSFNLPAMWAKIKHQVPAEAK